MFYYLGLPYTIILLYKALKLHIYLDEVPELITELEKIIKFFESYDRIPNGSFEYL